MMKKKVKVVTDDNGIVMETLRSDSEIMKGVKDFGQNYLIVIKPGKTKGLHYHKRQTEFFTIFSGEVMFYLGKERMRMSGEKPITVRVDPSIGHAIENIGDRDAVLFIYTTLPYNPENPDAYKWSVKKG